MPDPDLILHHYDASPFSEKIRTILGHKRLAWCAVGQPTIMPKPQLTPLTGGYRRIPVLQIGADVYCDSQLIARVLEARHPEPTIFPGGGEAPCTAMALWADRIVFWAAVPVLFDLVGDALPKAFIDDRAQLSGGRIDLAAMKKQAPAAREQVRASAALLNAQLADGRPFLLGDAFSLADAACYHPIWFLRGLPGASSAFDDCAALSAWADRVRDMGHGGRENLDADAALRIARDAMPLPGTGVEPGEPNALEAGMRVAVMPDDYGFDPVSGELVTANPREVAVRRSDAELGDIVVHFPRIGFQIRRA
jgi:glutathione S-transferase